jgi:hypothetical protein
MIMNKYKRLSISYVALLLFTIVAAHFVANAIQISWFEVFLWFVGPPLLLALIVFAGFTWSKWVEAGGE